MLEYASPDLENNVLRFERLDLLRLHASINYLLRFERCKNPSKHWFVTLLRLYASIPGRRGGENNKTTEAGSLAALSLLQSPAPISLLPASGPVPYACIRLHTLGKKAVDH